MLGGSSHSGRRKRISHKDAKIAKSHPDDLTTIYAKHTRNVLIAEERTGAAPEGGYVPNLGMLQASTLSEARISISHESPPSGNTNFLSESMYVVRQMVFGLTKMTRWERQESDSTTNRLVV